MRILVLNPGGNSLKAEIVSCERDQQWAFEGRYLVSAAVEGIGRKTTFSRYEGKQAVETTSIEAASYGAAADFIFRWLQDDSGSDKRQLDGIEAVGVRVVHGGLDLTTPTALNSEVQKKITALEKLAPLHNQSSIEVLEPVRRWLGETPVLGVFDTAFHRTIPEHVALYALPFELSQKHHIRRYGFHGISHRYLLERYAHLAGKEPRRCNLVSTHLESGCSVTAIRGGESIDNSMGITPLEGLMMGTRSGDIDPSIVSFLINDEAMSLEEVMTMLNKKSGLLGVSGESLDTRVLMKDYESNPRAKLAMEMFSYRVTKTIGGYLAAVGDAEAVIFGGGIAENTPLVRERVGTGLRGFGLELDPALNDRTVSGEARISIDESRLKAWVIPVEEGLQIAHECCEQLTR